MHGRPIALLIASALAFGTALAQTPRSDPGALQGFETDHLIFGADSIESNESAGRGDCDIEFQLSFSHR